MMRTIKSRIVPVVMVALMAEAMLGTTSAAAQAVSCPTVDPTTGAVSPAPSQDVDWSGCNLTNAALGDFDLTGDNFSDANLTGASFRLATMINVNLSGATLAGTSFNSVILTNGDLANATVTSDDFTNAALAGTNLTGADLSAATLDGVTSGGISDSQGPSAMPAGWRFTVGYLVGPTANLFDANLTGGNLSGLKLAGLSLTGVNLTDADLSGTGLSGSSLWKADLTGADLAGAVVTNANFQQSVLTGTNLSGVDLSTVNLTFVQSGGISTPNAPTALPTNWKFVVGYLVGPNANLDGGNLAGANLSGMDLAYTTMNGANLARADLNGAQMKLTSLATVRSGGITGQPASLPSGLVLKYGYILGSTVDLDGANLAGDELGDLDLSLATLTGADLVGADLTGTNLGGSNLTGANLQGAIFGGTNLFEAVLTGDNLAGLNLANSNLSLAALKDVNLTAANLSGDDLTGADLARATLTGLRSGGITGAPSYLPAHWSTYYGYLLGPKADLEGANLRGDFLVNLDLAGATLTKANLSGANVKGSELAGANLALANFSGADLTGAELNAIDAYLIGVNWAGATCPDGRKAGKSGCFPGNAKPRSGPQISVSLRVGPPASAIRVTGGGFKPTERVAIHFGSAFVIATGTTGTGRLEPVTITVPQQALPGLVKITGTARLNGQSASAWFTVQDDWVQSQFGPTLDGDNGYENTLTAATVSGLRTKWTFNPGTTEALPPVVANGRAYVATLLGNLYAVNASTGRKIWSWTVPGGAGNELATLAVAGNTVYESGSGFLYAIGPGGKQEWRYAPPFPASASSGSAPTVQGAVVYYSADNVSAVNAASGRQLWSVNPTSGSGCSGQPAVSDGVVYVTCNDGNLYALSAANGATLWSYSNNGTDLMSPAVAGGVVYVGETQGDVVHAISTASHAQVWSYMTGGRIATIPAVANGTVYVSSFDGNLYALNAATGVRNWAFTLGTVPIPFAISPAVAGQVVYVTSSNEIVYGLNAATGAKLWSYSKGNVLQSGPVVADGTVYVGTGHGGLYAFGLAVPGVPGKGQR